MNYELFKHKNKWIFLVDMRRETDYIFSEITKASLKKQIKNNKKIWIIVNKKWFSNGIFCQKCGYVPKCNRCDVNISYYKINENKIGLCNICKTQYNFPLECPHCHSAEIKEFWIGTQRIAEYIQTEYKVKTVIIDADTTRSQKKIKEILEQKDIQIYIWTSLLNTPIKWVELDLIIFLNADIGLNIPDYSAAKNNFHFLYDTFTSHTCKNYIVQTFNPEVYSIRNACKMDKELFTIEDNQFRKKNLYPPFSDVCVISYKDEIEEKLFNKIDIMYKDLLYLKDKYQMNNLEIYTTPPLIYKMFNKYRYNIILKWESLRNFMDIVYTKLRINQKRFKVDRNTENII